MSAPPWQQDPWTRVRTVHDFPADEVISALQKEIRRGNLENAALLAWEMLNTSEELEEVLWSRLQVISVEDVGFGDPQAPLLVETLYQMHLRLPRPRGDRYLFAIHALRFLCQSVKDRSSDELLNWLSRAVEGGLRPEIPDYALDIHTRRGQQLGRGMQHFLQEGAQVAPRLTEDESPWRRRLLDLIEGEDAP